MKITTENIRIFRAKEILKEFPLKTRDKELVESLT